MRRKGLNSIETKYIQGFGGTGDTLGAASTIYNLRETDASVTPTEILGPKIHFTDIDKGTARSDRVGSKVFIKNLKFRCMVHASQSANSGDEVYVALVLVRVKQAIDSLTTNTTPEPLLTNIFQNITIPNNPPITQNTGTDSRVQFMSAFWNYYNKKSKNDYTVLAVKFIKVSKETGSDQLKKIRKWNFPINKPCNWDDEDNASDGHLYLYAISDITNKSAASATGDFPSLIYSWRTTFTDV